MEGSPARVAEARLLGDTLRGLLGCPQDLEMGGAIFAPSLC